MNYKKLIKEAKKAINTGIKRINKRDKNPYTFDGYAIVASVHSIQLTDAIDVLCRKGFTKESLPILRSLIENTIKLNWIISKDSKNRFRNYLKNLTANGFGKDFTSPPSLDKKMEEVGFPNRDYYDLVVKFTYDYAHVNARGLDWNKAIEGNKNKHHFDKQAIYAVNAQMLGLTLKALNNKFGGFDYNKILNQIKIDKNAREKLEFNKI